MYVCMYVLTWKGPLLALEWIRTKAGREATPFACVFVFKTVWSLFVWSLVHLERLGSSGGGGGGNVSSRLSISIPTDSFSLSFSYL